MPLGIAMGAVVMTMIFVHSKEVAYPLLILVGALSGFLWYR